MSVSPVSEMFDGISPHYDFLNHLLSFGIDRRWRRKTSQMVSGHHPSTILDVATGTADLAIRMALENPQAQVIGVDFSEKMLEQGRVKIERKKLGGRICLMTGNALGMPFSDNAFDAVTVAFGVRNFDNREAGLREMVRVCRKGGLVAVLEFSHPSSLWMARPYRWYSRTILPWLGHKVSKHPTAYTYLPSSVEAFPESKAFIGMLHDAGLCQVTARRFSGGIATLYFGIVAENPLETQ